MKNGTHVVQLIGDRTHVGEARRVASALAHDVGLGETEVGSVGLVVTEAATNILKHAGSGQLLIAPLRDAAGGAGIEVLALDRGAGMADVDRCLQDGFSTAGSPGTGLGAMSRMASTLEIYSRPEGGTALLIRVLARGGRPGGGALRVGAVCVAAPGESECGDAWGWTQQGERCWLMVVDGLGHGPLAALAAQAAVRAFEAGAGQTAQAMLETMHQALLPTRGAAVSVAELDREHRQVHYAGLGNVTGVIAWPGGSRALVGQNGTVGGEQRRIRSVSYPWTDEACLVLYSDGLSSRLAVNAYPGLLQHDPSLIAGVLFRDHVRGRDDATVVVACPNGSGR
jgi:anti-sigma regulatory factor (Ser/Thr protein kinase)